MRHGTLRRMGVVLAVAGLAGCAARRLSYTPAPLAGLSNPSIHVLVERSGRLPVTGSFGWGYALFRIPQDPGVRMGAIHERLQAAMRTAFTAKGLAFAETEPDLLVSYALAADAAIDAEELDQAYADLASVPVVASGVPLLYRRGVLVLDVVERASGRLLWRGAITADLDLAWPEERKQERCDAAVGELLRHYPTP